MYTVTNVVVRDVMWVIKFAAIEIVYNRSGLDKTSFINCQGFLYQTSNEVPMSHLHLTGLQANKRVP